MFSATDIFLAMGRRGSGKSYLLRGISSAYPRKVIFDPLHEYRDSDGILCPDFSEFGKKILETENSETFTLILQPDIEQESETQALEFDEALRVLYYRGNLQIKIEELQLFASPYKTPLWLKNCLFLGRHRNLSLSLTTQRPGECPKSVISQANHVFCGSLHDRNDIDYCRTVLGEYAFQLPVLPDREFYYFRPGQALSKISPQGRLLPLAVS